MAIGRQNITQRIVLEGGEEIRKNLEAIGKTGEKVFKQLEGGGKGTLGGGLTNSLRKAQVELKQVAASFDRISNSINRVGFDLTTKLTLPIIGFGAASLKAFGDFEKGMSNVATIVDTTKESMDDMNASVLDISKRVPVGISDLTAALYDLRSAGISADDAMGLLENSAKLAVAGLGTTGEAVDLVTSILNTWGNELRGRTFDTKGFGKATRALRGDFQGPIDNVKSLGLSLTELSSKTDAGGKAFDVLRKGIRSVNPEYRKVIEAAGGLGEQMAGTTASAEDQARVFDVLFKAIEFGKTTLPELARGFGSVSGIVKEAGVALDEYFAAVAAMTSVGLPAAEAHTQIRAALNQLNKETPETIKLFKKLGVTTFKELIHRSGGMVGAFEEIVKATDGNTASLIKLLGSTEAFNAVISLTGSTNATYVRALESMRSGVNSLDIAFQKKAGTIDAATQLLRNSFNRLFITVGVELAPAFIAVSEAIIKLVDTFSALPPRVRTFIVLMGAIAATFGPLLIGLSLLVKGLANFFRFTAGLVGFTALITSTSKFAKILAGLALSVLRVGRFLSPLVLIVGAVAAAFLLLTGNVDAVKDTLSKGWTSITNAIALAFKGVADIAVIEDIRNSLSGLWKGLLPDVKSVWKSITNIVWDGVYEIESALSKIASPHIFPGMTEKFLGNLKGSFGDVSKTIIDVFTSMWDRIKSTAASTFDFILEQLQRFNKTAPVRKDEEKKRRPGGLLDEGKQIVEVAIIPKVQWERTADGFRQVALKQTIETGFVSAISSIPWGRIFSAIWDFLKSEANFAFDLLKTNWLKLATILGSTALFSVTFNPFQWLIDGAMSAFTAIGDAFSSLGNFLRNSLPDGIVSTFDRIWEGMVSGAKAVSAVLVPILLTWGSLLYLIFGKRIITATKALYRFATGGKVASKDLQKLDEAAERFHKLAPAIATDFAQIGGKVLLFGSLVLSARYTFLSFMRIFSVAFSGPIIALGVLIALIRKFAEPLDAIIKGFTRGLAGVFLTVKEDIEAVGSTVDKVVASPFYALLAVIGQIGSAVADLIAPVVLAKEEFDELQTASEKWGAVFGKITKRIIAGFHTFMSVMDRVASGINRIFGTELTGNIVALTVALTGLLGLRLVGGITGLGAMLLQWAGVTRTLNWELSRVSTALGNLIKGAGINGTTKQLAALRSGFLGLGVALGGRGVLGTIVAVFAVMKRFIRFLLGPWQLGITVAALTVRKYWEPILGVFVAIVGGLVDGFNSIANGAEEVQASIITVSHATESVGNGIATVFAGIASVIADVILWILRIAEPVHTVEGQFDGVRGAAEKFGFALRTLFEHTKANFESLISTLDAVADAFNWLFNTNLSGKDLAITGALLALASSLRVVRAAARAAGLAMLFLLANPHVLAIAGLVASIAIIAKLAYEHRRAGAATGAHRDALEQLDEIIARSRAGVRGATAEARAFADAEIAAAKAVIENARAQMERFTIINEFGQEQEQIINGPNQTMMRDHFNFLNAIDARLEEIGKSDFMRANIEEADEKAEELGNTLGNVRKIIKDFPDLSDGGSLGAVRSLPEEFKKIAPAAKQAADAVKEFNVETVKADKLPQAAESIANQMVTPFDEADQRARVIISGLISFTKTEFEKLSAAIDEVSTKISATLDSVLNKFKQVKDNNLSGGAGSDTLAGSNKPLEVTIRHPDDRDLQLAVGPLGPFIYRMLLAAVGEALQLAWDNFVANVSQEELKLQLRLEITTLTTTIQQIDDIQTRLDALANSRSVPAELFQQPQHDAQQYIDILKKTQANIELLYELLSDDNKHIGIFGTEFIDIMKRSVNDSIVSLEHSLDAGKRKLDQIERQLKTIREGFKQEDFLVNLEFDQTKLREQLASDLSNIDAFIQLTTGPVVLEGIPNLNLLILQLQTLQKTWLPPEMFEGPQAEVKTLLDNFRDARDEITKTYQALDPNRPFTQLERHFSEVLADINLIIARLEELRMMKGAALDSDILKGMPEFSPFDPIIATPPLWLKIAWEVLVAGAVEEGLRLAWKAWKGEVSQDDLEIQLNTKIEDAEDLVDIYRPQIDKLEQEFQQLHDLRRQNLTTTPFLDTNPFEEPQAAAATLQNNLANLKIELAKLWDLMDDGNKLQLAETFRATNEQLTIQIERLEELSNTKAPTFDFRFGKAFVGALDKMFGLAIDEILKQASDRRAEIKTRLSEIMTDITNTTGLGHTAGRGMAPIQEFIDALEALRDVNDGNLLTPHIEGISQYLAQLQRARDEINSLMSELSAHQDAYRQNMTIQGELPLLPFFRNELDRVINQVNTLNNGFEQLKQQKIDTQSLNRMLDTASNLRFQVTFDIVGLDKELTELEADMPDVRASLERMVGQVEVLNIDQSLFNQMNALEANWSGILTDINQAEASLDDIGRSHFGNRFEEARNTISGMIDDLVTLRDVATQELARMNFGALMTTGLQQAQTDLFALQSIVNNINQGLAPRSLLNIDHIRQLRNQMEVIGDLADGMWDDLDAEGQNLFRNTFDNWHIDLNAIKNTLRGFEQDFSKLDIEPKINTASLIPPALVTAISNALAEIFSGVFGGGDFGNEFIGAVEPVVLITKKIAEQLVAIKKAWDAFTGESTIPQTEAIKSIQQEIDSLKTTIDNWEMLKGLGDTFGADLPMVTKDIADLKLALQQLELQKQKLIDQALETKPTSTRSIEPLMASDEAAVPLTPEEATAAAGEAANAWATTFHQRLIDANVPLSENVINIATGGVSAQLEFLWLQLTNGARLTAEDIKSFFGEDGFVSFIKTQLSSLGTAVAPAMTPVTSAVQTTMNAVASAIKTALSGIPNAATAAGNSISSAMATAADRVKDNMVSMSNSVTSMINNINAALQRLMAAIARAKAAAASARSSGGGGGFARGGPIRGPGTGTSDSFLIAASDGEFMIRNRAVRKYGSRFMHMINNLQLPADMFKGFAGGGMVGIDPSGLAGFASGLGNMSSNTSFIPAMAGGGDVSSSPMRPVEINLNGETIDGVAATDEALDKLYRVANTKRLRSAGRKPGWS